MAETPADVRRDIELTRDRMSSTIDQLEQKLNVRQVIADHPWPALAVALGAGLALATSKSEGKVVAAAKTATKGAGSKLGGAIDDIVAGVMASATAALHNQVDTWVEELKTAVVNNGKRVSSPSYGVGPVDLVPDRGPVTPKDVPRAD